MICTKILTSKPTIEYVQSSKGESCKVEQGTSVAGMRVLWGDTEGQGDIAKLSNAIAL